jgi:2-polyprenyl-6-methoxyphenol hydroxylase-like FAD-dependent oxidoreductase
MNPTDVLIIGAGPTGLALAFQLRRLGVACRILEKNAGPSTTSKALGLQYRVSEVLAWMGLAPEFLARGEVGAAIDFHAEGRVLFDLHLGFASEMAGAGAYAPRAIILPQSETEAILLGALKQHGGAVEWGATFLDFAQDDRGVRARVRLSDGTETTIAARYLVSCEGAHSTVRKQAGIAFTGKTYPLDFAMADVHLDWHNSHDRGHVWFHRDGMFAAMAMPGAGRWRLFVDITGVAREDTAVDLALVQRIMVERTGETAPRASQPTWLTRFKINCRMVDRYRVGRVFLAGDAAHIHSPAGGQGITTGVQDAYNLAWKLALVLRGAGRDDLLDTYEEERLPIAREVLSATDRNTRIMWTRGPVRQWLRDRLVLPLLRRPWVQRRVVFKMTQLGLHYRGRRLSETRGRFARLRAGDRAPDVVLAGGGTLFDRLQRSRFVALLIGETDHPDTRAALAGLDVDVVRVADPRGELTRLYGPRPGALLLVRPDGYLGYVGPAGLAAVRPYLERIWTDAALAHATARPDLAPTPAPATPSTSSNQVAVKWQNT